MVKLEWKKLLCTDRMRESTESKNMDTVDDSHLSVEVRNQFEADYDRIVGSSSVRRLQDKAQVFPLQENDFVRTRLTHSMEVSALARSMGKAAGRKLEEKLKSEFTPEMTEELAALLQTAGLIHDLGNPPFGHYGETVIRQWFLEWFSSCQLLKKEVLLSEQEKQDFIRFDGNVQNLRIVTKLQVLNDAYGVNFTFATLATIIKYPWKSDADLAKKEEKFGYFKSEQDIIKQIYEKTGLKEEQRHPATYLLEAADDIIYICDDIEDGVKKGYIPWNMVYEKMKEKFTEPKYKLLFERIDKKKPHEEMNEEDKTLARVHMFRNLAQGYLMQAAVNAFIENHELLLEKDFCKEYELLKNEVEFVDYLKSITAKYCFGCHEVLALELVGDKVIKTLLDVFVPAIVESNPGELKKTKLYAGKLYALISSSFKFIAQYDYEKKCQRDLSEISIYDKLHLVVDFVSGMTDSYAVNLYKELTGIKLPQ